MNTSQKAQTHKYPFDWPLSTAKISSPVSDYLVRNPRYANQGKFLKLSDFLAIVMDSDLYGAMIIIEVIPSLEVLLILI